MADFAASFGNSTTPPRACLTEVDEALLTLLTKRLARAQLLETDAKIATEAKQPRLDSTQLVAHS
jgi:hypothetical protein